MTIGIFLTICILGLVYVVWSYYAIMDFITTVRKGYSLLFDIQASSLIWLAVTFTIIIHYLHVNWDKPLW